MADPATPTEKDRAETLAVARQWLDAVREDRPVRVDIRAIYGDTNGFVTALCQEVTLLAEQLAERDAQIATMHRGYRDLHDMLPGNGDVWSKVDDLKKQLAEVRAARDDRGHCPGCDGDHL